MEAAPSDHVIPPSSKLVAGELCLDFANTADWHASRRPRETLTSYETLLAWAVRAGVLPAEDAARLGWEAARHPVAAVAALRQALALREAIYRVATSMVSRQAPLPADVEKLDHALAGTLQHRRLAVGPDGPAWTWNHDGRALERVVWPVALSAGDLFTSDRRERIGQCADDRGCGWLFLDTTKNHSRKWCAMDDCGNRAKAQRHYRRSRHGAVHPAVAE